jgi:PelA/Pel-15E family pectate lyase
MTAVASGATPYSFVPSSVRHEASVGATRALDCILSTQVVVNGRRTAWAQQHDALTLQPVSGRNYEPASISSGESADLLLYLMRIPNPSPQVVASIDTGIAWLRSVAIEGQVWTVTRGDSAGRHLEPHPGANPLWARFYSIATNKPVFGDRDKTIHDNVADLSLERRNGYAWFGSAPQQALDAYSAWRKNH